MRGSHSCKIRAVAIVSHHQWCARLELIANRLVDRNRLSARAQWLAGNVFECDGNDRFRARASRQSVGGNLQGTREKIGNLHPFLKAHRSRTNLGRIRVQAEESIDGGKPLGVTGEVGHKSAVERTTLHCAGLGIERLLDGLQIEGAKVRAHIHGGLEQSSWIEKQLTGGISQSDQHGHGANTIDGTFRA